MGKAPVSAPPFGEERGALRTAEENPAPKVTKQVTAADSSDRDLRRCPACGSADYHRTRRTKLERILSRPKVAHCEKCGLRFPFPGDGHRSSSSVKLGEAVATVPRSAEEKRAPKMAEENNQPKIKQASHRRGFVEPWIAPLSGLRQHGIPPYQAHHPGTPPVAPTDGPLREVRVALPLSWA